MFTQALLLPVLMAASGLAAAPPIGVVTASGHFTLDRAEVWGNTTLFDGGKLETGSASSEAILRNGVKIQLGSASSASVSEHRLTLTKGTGQVAAQENYEVNAGGLSIRSASGTSRLRVGWSADGRIEVAALAGGARVANGTGAVLASIPAGGSVRFAMQAAAAGTVTRVGCLLYKDGHFLIQDQNTQEVTEVTGTNLALNVGNRVSVTGTASSARPAVSIATSVLNATTVTTQGSGGCLSVAAALDAQTNVSGAPAVASAPTAPASGPATAPAATAASKTGMSTGTKIAIAAGVAGGGAGAAIALGGGKKSTSP
jgi:hypothetical protein